MKTVIWTDPRKIWSFLRFVYASFHIHKGIENAKSLTYTSLFSVVPLLTLTVAILSVFPTFQVFASQLQGLVFEHLLPSSTSELLEYITRFTEQARNLTFVGAAMLLVTSYLMLVNIERSFNHIWGVGEVRKGLYSFLLYWSVLSLGPLLLGLAFGISSYVTSLSLFDRLSGVPVYVGFQYLLLQVFPFVLSALGFTLLYLAVPNCGVRLRDAVAGGIVVALTFIVVKFVFTRFMAMASFEFVYGTFAAVPIFLIWIYLSWVVILVGANLVRSIPLFEARQEAAFEEVHPTLLMLALLHKFWEKWQQGCALDLDELGKERWPFSAIKLETYLELLTRKRIVHASTRGEYLLARDLRTLSLWELLSWLPWAVPGAEDLEGPLPEILERHLPDFPTLRRKIETLEECGRSEFSDSLDVFFRLGKNGDGGYFPSRK